MWVRSQVFDHGAVPFDFLDEDHVNAKLVSNNGNTTQSCLFEETLERLGFEFVGKVIVGLRSRGLGVLLLNTTPADVADAFFQVVEEIDYSCLKSSECRALVELFFSLQQISPGKGGPNRKTQKQMEAEFAVFLIVQLSSARKSGAGKEVLTVWPPEQGGVVLDTQDGQTSPISNSMKSPRSLGLAVISKENKTRLEFVRTHIREIFWILSLCDSTSNRADFLANWDNQVLSFDTSLSLGFLIEGLVLPDRVECVELECMVLGKLELNDNVNPMLQNTPWPSSQHETDHQGKHVFSFEDRYKLIEKVCRSTEVCGDVDILERTQSHAKDDATSNNNKEDRFELEDATVVLEKLTIYLCKSSTIYVLQPARFVRIIGCSKCTIVLGPCSGIVTLEHCSEVQIIGISNYLSIGNCYDSQINVHTIQSAPVLFGDCLGLQFAPFNTFYPRLNLHLASIGMDISTQTNEPLWNAPLNVSAKSESPVWTILTTK
uniref:TBCC domain-containing protein 1 n=1 Tax=Mucochytrium quahogii TaxID=96639 RepID=A0A7S2WIK0_9STRA|mmetsp:Transcript_24941/g.53833  ORF Transcript_24941/g.53833 Transcript_24941/m.53833 type:complete len:489 (+) Transcript_24941:56-1522(+)